MAVQERTVQVLRAASKPALQFHAESIPLRSRNLVGSDAKPTVVARADVLVCPAIEPYVALDVSHRAVGDCLRKS